MPPQDPNWLGQMPSSADLLTFAIHLLVTVALSWLVGRHFVAFGQVLSNRRRLARVLVFVSATTLLIVTVVKVSVALSLGLVGALSIIRFRTPVKEPEELAYLFLAVAIGVGVGADRRIETALATLVILVAMALIGRARGPSRAAAGILHIAAPLAGQRADVSALTAALAPRCARIDLRRVDVAADRMQVDFHVELRGSDDAQALLDEVRSRLPDADVSLIDRTGLE
jgi:uncharacterized membrane protein YhiD involved in acid resistance